MASKVGLCDLPPELQDFIIPILHPSAAIALLQTCRWYHSEVSLRRLDYNQVRVYLHELELLPRNDNNYACFSCLRLKPITSFTTAQVGAKNSRNGVSSTKRSCLECDVQKGKIKPGRFLYIAKKRCIETTSANMCNGCQAMRPCLKSVESTLAVMCGGCLTIQTYFCDDCYWCMGCVMKAKTWIGFGVARRNVSLGEASE